MDPAPPRGLLSSLRGLAVDAVDLLKTRLELLTAELEEEKVRLLSLLTFGAIALVFLAAGLVFLAVFLTVLFWEGQRLLALGVFTTLFLTAGTAALLAALARVRAGSRLFAASLAELSKDRAALEPRE